MEKDLKNYLPSGLADIITPLGGKRYQAADMFCAIHQKLAGAIGDFTTVKKEIRNQLIDAGYYIGKIQTEKKLADPDGTEKYLFKLTDGNSIESVLLRESGRNTVCISSQVGCSLGCRFCATGYLEFKRNLTVSEIIDQVLEISKSAGVINNIVFMGMGEPFLNYDNVLKAVRILSHPKGLNIGIRRQTISTAGIIAGIKKLANEDILPRLAVSLHAADDQLRKKLMPVAAEESLSDLIEAMKYYQQKTSRRITIEYCMIAGVNDSAQSTRKLVQILKPLQVNVNLIEYNPHPGCDLSSPGRDVIERFRDMLMKAGIETIIRYRRGRGVKAACGQLGAERLK